MANIKIVVLFNGTGNDDKDPAVTNVVKMRDALIKDDSQIVIYRDGIGNDQQWHWKLVRYFAELTGWGGGWIMDQAYDELNRTIDEAIKAKKINAHDTLQIYVGGFSRGAALARHFANDYMMKFIKVMNDKLPSVSIDIVAEYLFDTVASFGIPMNFWLGKKMGIYNQEIDIGWHFDIPPNTLAYHAVAIDEHRDAFNPHLVDFVQDMTQEVWFDGDHSSIGGGYAPTNPNDVMGDENPLRFMVRHAINDGLRFDRQFIQKLKLDEVEHPIGHIETPDHRNLPATQRINRRIRVQINGKRSNSAPLIAKSVIDRIQSERYYRPENISDLNRFDILDENENIASFQKHSADEPWSLLSGAQVLQFSSNKPTHQELPVLVRQESPRLKRRNEY